MKVTYQRTDVEQVLPYLYDAEAAYGIKSEIYVEDGMPKGYSDPSKGNSIFASLADVRRAWDHGPLSAVEKQAVFMRYVLDDILGDIAGHQGVSERGALYRVERGVGKLTAHLNGDKYIDGYDQLEDEQ
ncbi:sigma factor [Streptomyces phage Omar]|uniref:DNA binding protein n=1 Tax=Streptomyces phage Omar TaxID=2059882 RepID=A0A2H5BLP8_9CAUD|nr:sigma factor [Streptomyces phage Omar]AUG87232.1 DNA binding protein [Streptomyces phage Omar]